MIFKIDCWVREIAILISCDEYDKGNRVGEGEGGGGVKITPFRLRHAFLAPHSTPERDQGLWTSAWLATLPVVT